MTHKEDHKFSVGDKVLVSSSVLYRDNKGKARHKDLANEPGTIKKIDSGVTYYVQTQYGTHYLNEAVLTAAE